MGKLGKIIYYAVIVLLVLIFVIVLINDSFAGSGFGLYITIALGVLAVLGTLVSSVIHLVNNPKGAKSLIIGAAVLLIAVSYPHLTLPTNMSVYSSDSFATLHKTTTVIL